MAKPDNRNEFQLREQTAALRARRETLAAELAERKALQPRTASQIQAELEAAPPALPDELMALHQTELAAAERALAAALAHKHEREERAAGVVAQLQQDTRGVEEMIRAAGEREHAALREAWERMLPNALDQWRWLDERCELAQKTLLTITDETRRHLDVVEKASKRV
mgnify:CR=1 FL=1|tara:strand:+ start:124 stop:627 length:504 start_codon:yes stop_codon:yes gene_type:complete